MSIFKSNSKSVITLLPLVVLIGIVVVQFRAFFQSKAGPKVEISGQIYTDMDRLIDNKNYDEAIRSLTKVIKSNASHPDICKYYYLRGKTFYRKKDFENALKDSNAGIKAEISCAEAYNIRGVLSLDKRDLSEALKDFNDAIEIDPKFAKAYSNRAIVYYKWGMDGYSWNDLNVALALGYKEFGDLYKKVEGIVNVRDGSYKEFNKDQVLEGEYIFKGGLFHGTQLDYFKNGDIEEKCEYREGLRDGTCIFYSEDGHVNGVSNYKAGRQDGLNTIYYPNGQVLFESIFKDGKENGIMRHYSETGVLLQELFYKEGRPAGVSRFYDENGKLLKELNLDSWDYKVMSWILESYEKLEQ